MVSYIADRTSVGRDFLLSDLRDNSTVEHVLELPDILVMSLVVNLTSLLADLTGLGVLGIVNQHSRVLFEGIFGLQVARDVIEGNVLLEDIVFLFLLCGEYGCLAATDPALGHPDFK